MEVERDIATLSESVGKFNVCLSLCNFSVLCVSVVSIFLSKFTAEAQSTQRSHRGLIFIPTDSFRVAFSRIFDWFFAGLPERNPGLELANAFSVRRVAD